MESMLHFLQRYLKHADLDTATKANLRELYCKEKGLKALSKKEKDLFSEALKIALDEVCSTKESHGNEPKTRENAIGIFDDLVTNAEDKNEELTENDKNAASATGIQIKRLHSSSSSENDGNSSPKTCKPKQKKVKRSNKGLKNETTNSTIVPSKKLANSSNESEEESFINSKKAMESNANNNISPELKRNKEESLNGLGDSDKESEPLLNMSKMKKVMCSSDSEDEVNKKSVTVNISDSKEELLSVKPMSKPESDFKMKESKNQSASESDKETIKRNKVTSSPAIIKLEVESSRIKVSDSEDEPLINFSKSKKIANSSISEDEIIKNENTKKALVSNNSKTKLTKKNKSDSEDESLINFSKRKKIAYSSESEDEIVKKEKVGDSKDEPLITFSKSKKIPDSSDSEDEIIKTEKGKKFTVSNKSKVKPTKKKKSYSQGKLLIETSKEKKVTDDSNKNIKTKEVATKSSIQDKRLNTSDSENESVIHNSKTKKIAVSSDSDEETCEDQKKIINSVNKSISDSEKESNFVPHSKKLEKSLIKNGNVSESDSEDEPLKNISKAKKKESSSSEDETIKTTICDKKIPSDNESHSGNESDSSVNSSKSLDEKNASDSEDEPLISLTKTKKQVKEKSKRNISGYEEDLPVKPHKKNVSRHSESESIINRGKSNRKHVKKKQLPKLEDSSGSESEPIEKKLKKPIKEKMNEKSSPKENLPDNSSSSEDEKETPISKKNSKPSKEKQRKKKPSASENKRIEHLKKYVRAAGIRVKSYENFFENCKSMKAKSEKLLELLEQHGMKGRPTLVKCKKLKKKIETKKEIAELDVSNILKTNGCRSKRSACSDTTNCKDVKKPPTPVKRFSRLQDIVDSEGSD